MHRFVGPVVLLASALALGAQTARAQVVAGTVAPEVDLRTIGGERFQLSSLRGRPVVMTFWGTWCPPCRKEFPELASLYREFHQGGLEVVGVNQRDQEVSTGEVQRFVTELAATFPIVLDTRGRSRRAYRLIGLPTTVFIDKTGVIRQVVSGPVSTDILDAGLELIGIKRD